jgi:alkaline phosphatase
MQTGVKTKAGVIGVDETLARGDCSAVEGAKVATIGEILAEQGKSVGFVTTARITHATPASGYAHSADRNFEDNSSLPEGCDVPDIAAQLIDQMKAGVVDVAMGGGRRHFLPTDVTDEEGKTGKRTDGRNLIDEAKAIGAQYVHDDATTEGLTFGNNAPILALFESSHMKYENDRTGEPSLAEMTEAAIKALQGNDNGFFLQVEAGRVDHANHDGNLHRTLTDGVAFSEAVAKATEMTSPEDTLIIVTADHEHAIAMNGYCGRGTPINGLCYDIDNAGVKHTDEPLMGDDEKPFTVVMYLNGPGAIVTKQEDESYVGSRNDVSQADAQDPDYLQQAIVPMSSETHSGEDVAIYARGPWAHLVDGTVEQNYIFHVMHHAATAE